ncbi:type II secretion system F family protein [Azospirillum formosense]|uniref:Type II secretion system F family protein n=1 Tax=Azospirillum formosense TaxID=861533 RepID=A0ABX2KU51_9PROT|nr:type II secretion system F family protein [Azospirillum formosense]MBY3754586.1 type II secretion system F family protein [Azospirillum formosense]NUB18344.1 type II secretion system F family protein [Azospirillum formosense]
MTAPSALQCLVLSGGLILTAVLLALAAVVDRERDRFRARLLGVVRQASEQRATSRNSTAAAVKPLRLSVIALLRRVMLLSARLPLVRKKDQEDIRRLLVRAGIRGKESVALFVAAKLLGFGVGALLAGSAQLVLQTEIAPMMALAATLFSGFVGGLVPEAALQRRGRTRRAAIEAALPDALDLLIICANAGYGLDVSIQRVGREIARFFPDLADELAVTANEMQLLSDRREALDNLVERTNVPAIRSLVVTLLQAQRYGTPLTQALRTLAREERSARILALEERAARIPALISLPLMVLIMPAVLIVVAGPAFIDIMKGL